MSLTFSPPTLPRKRLRIAVPLIALLLAVGMTACSTPQNQEEVPIAASDTLDSITGLLTGDDRFRTLVTALDSAGLMSTLRDDGPFTLFAPTNAAFDQLPEGTVEELLQPEDRDRLVAILTYHLVEGTNTIADLEGTSAAPTIEGSDLPINTRNDGVVVGNATVIASDLEAGNGMIHVIDAVLLPPDDESP